MVRETFGPNGSRIQYLAGPDARPTPSGALKAMWPRIQALINKGNTPIESESGLLGPMQEMQDREAYVVVTIGLLVERLERAEARIAALENNDGVSQPVEPR